ncbi:MAG: hypothetical protein ABI147_10965 [Acidobacteriaceae bacterium]
MTERKTTATATANATAMQPQPQPQKTKQIPTGWQPKEGEVVTTKGKMQSKK